MTTVSLLLSADAIPTCKRRVAFIQSEQIGHYSKVQLISRALQGVSSGLESGNAVIVSLYFHWGRVLQACGDLIRLSTQYLLAFLVYAAGSFL